MKTTLRFFARRGAFYLFTAWAALTINFFIPRMMKGDAVTAYLQKHSGELPPEAETALRAMFGLDTATPLPQLYVDYWAALLRGDLGTSLSYGFTPVSEVIGSALPWTIGLVGVATVLSFVLGILLGAWVGWRRGRVRNLIVPAATFFGTVPYFWLGLIAVAVFSTTLGWLPASHAYGRGSTPAFTLGFAAQVVQHAILPAATVVLASFGGWALGMRNMMVTVLDEEYVVVARAKGLPARRVLWAYAARNAVLPQIQGLALAIGFIVGGTVVMEMVFSYPGVGKVLIDATNAKDYPLMQGLFLVITLSVLAANILADVVYAFLDPRTRRSEA